MENRQPSCMRVYALTAFLAGCMLVGCATTRWLAVEPGEYVVGRGQGEAHETAVRVIRKLEIDREQSVAAFTLADGSEVVASFVTRDQPAWPAGCPTNIYMDRMEVLDIEAETLSLDAITLSEPILVRSCPPEPVFVVLREDGEIGNARVASGSACSGTVTCIHFKPRRDDPWSADDTTVSTDEDSPVGIDIVASGIDTDEFLDPSTFAVTTGPAHGSIVNNLEATGTVRSDEDAATSRLIDLVTYTPNTGFVGADTFTYRICDSLGYCDTATVTVIVEPTSSNSS
jgi:hypothetical protein